MASHTVYAVASGKGGVGKTATTVNLGASLADAGYRVAIVDTDLGMANLGGFIGVEPDATLHEVLAGEASLESATYEALNGLAVVPSGISLNGFANVETAALSDAVGALRDAFDYVLLDLGAGLSHDTVLPLALADAVILVSTPQPAAIQDTAKTRQVTEQLGGRVAGVVLTRAGGPADMELDEISETLELPVLAVVPEDSAVPASAREGKAVLQHDPDSPVVAGYRGLAGIIESESLDDAPVVPEPRTPGEPSGTGSPAGDEPTPQSADAGGTEAVTDGAAAEPSAGEGQESTPEEPADDDAAADTADADAERTAAEIAAAIEDAAGGAPGPDDDAVPTDEMPQGTIDADDEGATSDAPEAPAEGPDDGASPDPGSGEAVEPDEVVDDLFEGGEAGGSGGSADPDDAAADVADDAPVDDATPDGADDAPTDDAAAEEAGLSVESTADDDEEGQAVDELFSVEGADPEEDEEEEESGGILGRFFG
jgi:septum site-determining protein MinD